jgi:hypothetical protein
MTISGRPRIAQRLRHRPGSRAAGCASTPTAAGPAGPTRNAARVWTAGPASPLGNPDPARSVRHAAPPSGPRRGQSPVVTTPGGGRAAGHGGAWASSARRPLALRGGVGVCLLTPRFAVRAVHDATRQPGGRNPSRIGSRTSHGPVAEAGCGMLARGPGEISRAGGVAGMPRCPAPQRPIARSGPEGVRVELAAGGERSRPGRTFASVAWTIRSVA